MSSAESGLERVSLPDRLAVLRLRIRRAWRPFWRGGRVQATKQAGPLPLLSRTNYFHQATCFSYIFLLVTLASIVSGQHLLEHVLNTHVKDMLAAEIHAHRMLQRQDSAEQLASAFLERHDIASRRERAVAVQAADGTLLYGAADLLAPQLCTGSAASCTGWLRALLPSTDGSAHEWLGLARALPGGGRYIIAYDVLPMLDRIYPVPLAAGLSVLTILLASLWVGLYFSMGAIRRIDRMRQAMRQFARGDMRARVPLGTVRESLDEFDLLGQEVNRALARIERLMEEVRNATNHIAHELRSPLTRLQLRLSNIAEATRGAPAIGLELALAEEETQHIQYLFRTVMRISEIETGRCSHEATPIDPHELLSDLKDYYEVLAEKRDILLICSSDTIPPAGLTGDRALLFQALGNLVDNAIKYSPSGSTVTLLARAAPGSIELGVADEGPGIDASLRSQAVQRFRRLTRDRRIGGHGLGLALVQAVTELHDGQLILNDNNAYRSHARHGAASVTLRGLLAILRLPVVPPASPDNEEAPHQS